MTGWWLEGDEKDDEEEKDRVRGCAALEWLKTGTDVRVSGWWLGDPTCSINSHQIHYLASLNISQHL